METIQEVNDIPYIKDGDQYYKLHYRKKNEAGRFEKHFGRLCRCEICGKETFKKFKDLKMGRSPCCSLKCTLKWKKD